MSNSKSNGNMSTLRLYLIDELAYRILEIIVTNGEIQSYKIHNSIKEYTTNPILSRLKLLLQKGLVIRYIDTGEVLYKATNNGITFYNLLKQAKVLIEIDYDSLPVTTPIISEVTPK